MGIDGRRQSNCPFLGPSTRPDRQPDVVPDQPVKQPVDAAEFLELVEDQADNAPSLLVGVKIDLAGRQNHVAHRHCVEQFAALGPCCLAHVRGDCA